MAFACGRPLKRGPPVFLAVLGFATSIAPCQQAPLPAEEAEPAHAIPTRVDRIGRIVLPVLVNQQGPFPFVLDTGANTTVISPRLAQTLAIAVDAGRVVNLHGITGVAAFPTAFIERVQSGAFLLQSKRLAVANASAVGTDGILGMDGLARKLILVDFARDRVAILDAARHRPPAKLIRVPARIRFKRLLVVDALVNGRKTEAVIDTGGQHTLGNQALYDALGFKPAPPALKLRTEVVGATEARQPGERRLIRDLQIKDMRTVRLAVTFGDFYIFDAWGLTKKPALVIGMDVIGVLDTFGIDYLRREVQIGIK